MPFKYEVDEGADLVRVAIAGNGDANSFIATLRSLGAESVRWKAHYLLVDLTGVEAAFAFTEQIRIGQAVAVNFKHLKKHAAIVRPERITHVGEKAAQHHGTAVRVFPTEADAIQWLSDSAER
jgi:hypothetical protein